MLAQRRRQGVSRQPSLTLGSNGLRPQGYLFNKPVDIDLRQAHTIGDTIQARREGKLRDYIAPQLYRAFCDDQRSKTQHKQQTHHEHDDQLPIGDTPTFHEEWPKTNKIGHFRIMQVNIHGLNPSKNNLECDYYLQRMAAYQVDMSLAVEVNQPLENPTIRARLSNVIRGFDKHAHIQFGHGNNPSNNFGFQMGGEMTVIQGGATTYVESSETDPIGRWTLTQLGKAKLQVISAYRVGKGNDGIQTIRAMEMRKLMQRNHPLAKNPRKAFDHDIENLIRTKKTHGQPVLLCMDANSGYTASDIKDLERKTGLVNVIQHFHPDIAMPRTYDRGRDCIDFFLGCEEALTYIKRCGYLEFYALTPDDHRAMFLDLDTDKLQGKQTFTTPEVLRAPSLTKPSQASAFIHEYKTLLDKAGIIDKVEQIAARFPLASPTERHHLAQRLNKYDKVWVQLALAAARKAVPTFGGGLPWSPTLARAGGVARYWNQRIHCYQTTGDINGPTIPIPLYYKPITINTYSELESAYHTALEKWHKAKGSAADLRKQHLEDRAEQHALRHEISQEKALKQLLHREEVRTLHRRHGGIMGRNKRDVIKSLVIPCPSSTNPTATMEITDPTHIQSIILRRNAAKLGAAKNSIFNQDRLLNLMGDHGDTPTADSILNGTFNINDVDTWSEMEHKDELKTFLLNMQRPKDPTGAQIPDMKWTFEASEFRDTFSKKSETTGCGPSGITMHFYRLFCEDDELAELHAKFIMLPFRYGFTLERWQQSVHFMLQKLAIPTWEKLRIIQLMEGDFNGGLRYLFGRRLMHYADKMKISSESTYGGRKGKNCHDALARIQLAKERLRIMRTPSIGIDVDASACFDRQLRNLIGPLNRRSGASKEMNVCQTLTLQHMKHHVKIAQGVSEAFFHHTDDTPIFGSGQGSGAGVPNWHSHNETIIATYAEYHNGITMTTPDNEVTVNQNVISFVDDNTLMAGCAPDATPEDMYEMSSESLGSWVIVMDFTGGAVELEKCYLSLMAFDFNTYSLRKNGRKRGIPVLKKLDQLPGECIVRGTDGKPVTVKQVQPSTGRRLLGIRLSTDGNFRDEFIYRRDLAETQAGRLTNSTASPQDAYMIYAFRYCPALFYCLKITYFTKKECDKIQSPFINALLPKLRINRHLKRDVVWGPTRFGGLAFKDMSSEQLIQGTEHALQHVRDNTATGKTLVVTAAAYQLYLGIAQQFFRATPQSHPHRLPATHNKLTYLWEQLSAIECRIDLPLQWVPDPHKTCIMDLIISAQQRNKGTPGFITDEHVRLANACRLWLKVLYIEDLTADDNTIIMEYYRGTTQCDSHQFAMPYQEKPPAWVWLVWQEVLKKSCLSRNHQMETWNIFIPASAIPVHESLPTLLPLQLESSRSLAALVADLPTQYQQLLGEYTLPQDDGQALANALQTGNLDHYSDGSVKEGCASHAYTLRTEDDDESKAITGGGPTCGDPLTISSLRPEHNGSIAGSIWMWILEQKYEITEGSARSGIDNMAVITRLQSGTDSDGTRIHTLAADYDLWNEHAQLLQRMRTKVTFHHVKGHQDDLYYKDGKQGPMSRDAHWNIQMDRLAESYRLNQPTPLTAVFTSTRAAFLHKEHVVTTKVGQKIRDIIHSRPLRLYIQDKESWTDEVFDSVDWPAFERCMQKLSIHKRINVTKYIFNWQNTGRQKQLFEMRQAEREGRDPCDVGQCPMGCGEHEDSQHYLRCTKLRDARAMDTSFGMLQKWMKKVHTYSEIEVIFMIGLRHWTESGTPKAIWELANGPYRQQLEEAIYEQNQIGWGNAFKGRISTLWGDIQMEHYRTKYEDDDMPPHISSTWWAGEFLRQLLYMSLNAWQHRNDFLHDREKTTKHMQERSAAVEEMAKWYQDQRKFPTDDQHHFARTFLDRCTDTTAQIRLWIGKITDIYEYNSQTTLQGYFSTQ